MEELERITGDSPFNQAMLRGHFYRTGHELVGYYVPAPDGETYIVIRDCC